MDDFDWEDPDILASWASEPQFYEAPTPPGWDARQYQHAGVEYALQRDHAILGDAPGVGKTPECVMISNATEARRTLVVCPASLRYNWEREVWRWSTTENVSTYVTATAKDGVSPEADYNIISYDLLRNGGIFAGLMDVMWDHVILDEAHYLKDPKGNKRTHAVCAPDGLASVSGRFTLASGTILPNQPVECYNAVRLTCWNAIDCMSLESFRDHYYGEGSGFVTGIYTSTDERGDPVRKFGPHWSQKVRNVPRNLDELRWRLRKHVMVRRLKSQVLSELPPKQWQVTPLATTPAMRRAMKHPGWAMAEHLFEMDPNGFAASVPIDGAVSTAKRLLGESKIEATEDYVRQLLMEGREKIVVGAWHRTVLDELRRLLSDLGVAYMDGSTSPKKKQAAVDQFQEDPDTAIILGQMIPLGEGWTLTAAEDVVLPEPYWVPGKNDQLFDRVLRLDEIMTRRIASRGREGCSATGHVLVVPDTLDEQVMSIVIEKDRSIYAALDHRG